MEKKSILVIVVRTGEFLLKKSSRLAKIKQATYLLSLSLDLPTKLDI